MSFSKVPVLLAVLVVTGCGGEAAPRTAGPDVATLRSAPASSSAPAPAPAATRTGAVIRPDASSDEIHDLERRYFTCLRDNGAPSPKDGGSGPGQRKPTAAQERAAKIACADKEPVSWLEVERRDNPEFPTLLRVAAACLKKKGFHARVVQEPQWRLAYRDSSEFMRAGDTEADCIDEAFAARIKTYR
jgi:hypothetical protein